MKAVVPIAAALLLAISGPRFAAHQQRHPLGTHSQGVIKKDRDDISRRAYGSSRIPAVGPGYNFPYPDRPYGDPDHW